MTAMAFKEHLMNWLRDNNVADNVFDICYDKYPHFDAETSTVYIGLYDVGESANWFEEFLIERGLEWEGILIPILQFLHEVGHSQTVCAFADEDLLMCNFLKHLLDTTDSNKNAAFQYWQIDDEAAANKWLITFINEHSDAVIKLHQFFMENWDDSLDNMAQGIT